MIKKIMFISAFYIFSCLFSTAFAWPIYGNSIFHEQSGRVFVGGDYFSYMFNKDKYPFLENTVLVYDYSSKEVVNRLVFNGKVYSFSVSNSGHLGVAVFDSSNRQEYPNTNHFLYIYDKELKLIKIIPGIASITSKARYDWDINGNSIAYITAEKSNSLPFTSTGTWIFNIQTGDIKKIFNAGTDIRWSKSDGNIYFREDFEYIKNDHVYKYDTSTNTLTITDKHGIDISFDGKYYIGTEIDPSPEYDFKLYILIYDANNNIVDPFGVDINGNEFILYQLGQENFFIGKTNKILSFFGEREFIFDIDLMKVMRTIQPGHIIGWSNDMSKLIVFDSVGKFHIESTISGAVMNEFLIPDK